jgi:uncharacterized protein with ACT and thioredoxin-like domain
MTISEDELYELSYAKEPKRSSVVSNIYSMSSYETIFQKQVILTGGRMNI